MADPFPAEGALIAISEAEAHFLIQQEELAYDSLVRAIEFDTEVEYYGGDNWKVNHRMFTGVLIRAFELAWQLGDSDLAKVLYIRALSFANDPNCSSEQQHEEAVRKWNKLNRSWVQKFFPKLMRRLVGVRKFFRGVYDYEPQKRM